APPPFSIGSVTFDGDTLVAASAMVVIGFQSVLFWLFTQVYAGSEGFLPEEPKVQRVLEKLSLERGLVLGGLIGLAGVAGLVFSLLYWNTQKFSHLNYEHALRLMIPSVTALIVSCQVILGTFFLSILGINYDPFTRRTTRTHYAVTQEIFTGLLKNGYVFPKTTLGAISPSTGRTLPDRYIEGTCPICGYDSARGDQCDNCGNQLDPADLISPRSRINGETPIFRETEHYFLDLPAFAEVLGSWLQAKAGHWRPNVLKFSLNLLDDLQPRAITRDLDWGVPVPLDGWRDRPDKRIYVWFDAVLGHLSPSVAWGRRPGE